MTPQRLLIIGAPRSGTSLLAAMLGRHPECGIMHECLSCMEKKIVGKDVVGNKLCVPKQISYEIPFKYRLYDLLRKAPVLRRILPDRSRSIRKYLTEHEAKIVAIIRDGDAVVNSMLKRSKTRIHTAVDQWSQAVELIDRIKEEFPDSIIVVRFEDLVTDPESSVKRIVRHLSIAYDPVMLSGYAHNRKYPGREGIDAGKAETADRQCNIKDTYPAAYRKYLDLIQIAS
jgi:hypothetical protein